MAIRADRISCNSTLADCIVRILMLHVTMRTASEIAPEILLLCKNGYAVETEKKPAVKVRFSDYSLYSMCVRTS